MDEQLYKILSILRIIFGPRGREGFTVFGERRWIDRIENQQVILQEREDQRAARLFETDRDLLTSKACP